MSHNYFKLLLVINLILYICSVALFIVLPEFPTFNYSLFGGNLCLTIFFLIRFRTSLFTLFSSQKFKSFLGQFVNLFLIAAILGMINFLVIKNDYYFDLTRNNLHTLSDQSKKVIKLLGEDELKMVLFASRQKWKKYLNLLRLYDNESRKIELKAYDIDKELALVKLNQVKEEGTLIIEYKGQSFKTIAKDELSVTNLLLKILSPNKKVIYYTVGHNEMSFGDKSAVGANYLKDKIENNHFKLKPLELMTGIPDDASVIMVLNPQIEFLEKEIVYLKKYIENGGSLLFSFSPYFNGVLIENLVGFLKELGLEFHNILTLDRLAKQQGAQASIPVINQYKNHQITEGFNERTIFPISAAFSILSRNKVHWSSLVESTPFPGSWGEVSFEEVKQGKAKFDKVRDLKGPLSLFVVGEAEKSRFAAFASSSFIANQFKGQSNNFNLFLNTLSWMVKEDKLLSLSRPQLEGNIVYISDLQVNLIFYLTIFVIPFLLFGIGILFYIRKLRK